MASTMVAVRVTARRSWSAAAPSLRLTTTAIASTGDRLSLPVPETLENRSPGRKQGVLDRPASSPAASPATRTGDWRWLRSQKARIGRRDLEGNKRNKRRMAKMARIVWYISLIPLRRQNWNSSTRMLRRKRIMRLQCRPKHFCRTLWLALHWFRIPFWLIFLFTFALPLHHA